MFAFGLLKSNHEVDNTREVAKTEMQSESVVNVKSQVKSLKLWF